MTTTTLSRLAFDHLWLLFGDLDDDLFIVINHKLGDGDFLSDTFTTSEADLEKAAAFGVERSQAGADVWVRITPMARPPAKGKRGTADQSACMVALFADIDFKDGGVPDEATALDVLAKVPLKPSMVIRSGHGLHPYWVLNEPITDISEAKALAERWKFTIQSKFNEHGLKLDSVFDLARVLRLAGTNNYKAEPVPVELVPGDDLAEARLYSPDEIAQYLLDPDEPANVEATVAGRIRSGGDIEPALASMRKITLPAGEADGSKRLYAYACRAVEHDLADADAISAIRTVEAEHPFPRRYTDEQIIARVRDAEKKTTRGKAMQAGDGDGDERPRKSQATEAVELAGDAALFHDPADERAFATIDVDGHLETWPINGKGFRQWLGRRYYAEQGKAIGSQALQDAINVIGGMAIYDGPAIGVRVRLAEHDNDIYLDLCDEDWQAVKITSGGWSVVGSHECPVRFVRRRGMLDLPEPVAGGSVDDLRELVNVGNDDDWRLVVAFMVATLRPTGPYPVLDVHGEQGSGKSTACRMIRGMIDPNAAALRRPPRDERDLMIAASNGHLVAFDNLSGVSASLSDALCSLATGGGFATRELYSDDEEKLFAAQRPVMVNGIDEPATRPDLLDRCISITLPMVPEDRRLDEASLWRRYNEIRPGVLGALLDVVSGALARVEDVHLDRVPRMADFARWVVAAEPTLGWPAGSFIEAYTSARDAVHDLAIEASPVGAAITGLMAERMVWTGTSGELLAEIEANHSDESQRKRRGWPGSAKAMGNAVRRLAPNLRAVGVEATFARTGRRRTVRLEKLGTGPSQTSPPSPTPDQELETGIGGDDAVTVGDGAGNGVGMDRHHENPPHESVTGISDGSDGGDGVSHIQSKHGEVRL